MSTTSKLLPSQPPSMTTAELAAVSFLARYSGHTHELYSYQLRRWFTWLPDQRSGPAARDPTCPRRALHPQSGRGRSQASSINTMMHGLRGHRVLDLVGKGDKPATMPLTVPVLRVLEACRGARTTGPLIQRPVSGKPIDRRDAYRMVTRTAKAAGMPRHISPHSLGHAEITNALDAGVPLRDAQIPGPARGPQNTEHYDRARGNLDRHGVHFLTAYAAGV